MRAMGLAYFSQKLGISRVIISLPYFSGVCVCKIYPPAHHTVSPEVIASLQGNVNLPIKDGSRQGFSFFRIVQYFLSPTYLWED